MATASCVTDTVRALSVWNKGWNDIFRHNEWGKYPPLELVRFVARNFYDVPDRTAVRFLEIGCGPGANLLYLAQEGFAGFGIDGSQIALDRARQRLDAAGLDAHLRQGDVGHLPYSKESFDCVIDIECLYANSLADSRRIIDQVHRVLRPGGLFFSITYMTGMPGEETGRRLEGEPNTFLEMLDGPLRDGYGIIRLTSEDEIGDVFGRFPDIEYDYVIRSDHNRQTLMKEWLITCRK